MLIEIFRDKFHCSSKSRIFDFLWETEKILDSFFFGFRVVNDMFKLLLKLKLSLGCVICVFFHFLLNAFVNVPLTEHVVNLV